MPRGPAVVLVVDDDVDAQVVMSAALRQVGYEVMSAGDLAEARGQARSRTPDVAVLDSRLPDGDGLELAREWSTDVAMKAVAIVVLTGFSARQDVEAAILAGADVFLVKPCSGAALIAQIERLLTGRRPSQMMRATRV